MTINRHSSHRRRELLELRSALIARLERSIVLAAGPLLLSRTNTTCVVWRRSTRTGRPVIVSVWHNYYPAMRSMQRAANVAARAKYWEVRNHHQQGDLPWQK